MSQAPRVNRSFSLLLAFALAGLAPPALANDLPPAVPTSIVEPAPPIAVPPPPPASPGAAEAMKLLEADIGTRFGLRVQNPTQPNKLNDLGMDGQVQVFLSGQAGRTLRWQADFVGNLGAVKQNVASAAAADQSSVSGSAGVLDLIARFEFHDAFKLWFGRMIVPIDRSGLSTEWSIAPWLFPGRFVTGAAPLGARQGPYSRNDGATLWGQLGGGTFKYYLGAYDLSDSTKSPLYSGRLSLSLLNPEPGYGNASTYYGSKDILALGLGFQHQTDGSIPIASATTGATTGDAVADFNEFNIDLLFEKNLGAAGVIDLEGAFYKIPGGHEPATTTCFALASYLLPIEVGVGRFQPLFRLQQAYLRGSDDVNTLADAQLGYIIDGLKSRLSLGYQYSKVAGQAGNAILLGLQLQTR